jgi:hypothetical protein
MQVILQRAYRKCMSRSSESYNKAMPDTRKGNICREDKKFLRKVNW